MPPERMAERNIMVRDTGRWPAAAVPAAYVVPHYALAELRTAISAQVSQCVLVLGHRRLIQVLILQPRSQGGLDEVARPEKVTSYGISRHPLYEAAQVPVGLQNWRGRQGGAVVDLDEPTGSIISPWISNLGNSRH